MLDKNGIVEFTNVELSILLDEMVEVQVFEAQFGYVSLDDLERFVSAARAYLKNSEVKSNALDKRQPAQSSIKLDT